MKYLAVNLSNTGVFTINFFSGSRASKEFSKVPTTLKVRFSSHEGNRKFEFHFPKPLEVIMAVRNFVKAKRAIDK